MPDCLQHLTVTVADGTTDSYDFKALSYDIKVELLDNTERCAACLH